MILLFGNKKDWLKGEFQVKVLNLIPKTNGDQTRHPKVLFTITIHKGRHVCTFSNLVSFIQI